jgi:predicted DNA-binding transcriptional regulator
MSEEKVNEEKIGEEKNIEEKNTEEKVVKKEYLTPYIPGEVKKRLNENKDAIIAEYQAGATLQQLGLKYKTTAQTIKDFLEKNNIPRRKTGKPKIIPAEMIKEVFKKYREMRRLATINDIARELRTTEPTIRKNLRRLFKEGKLKERDLYLCSIVAKRNLIYIYGAQANPQVQAIEKKEEIQPVEKKVEPQTTEKKDENQSNQVIEKKEEPQPVEKKEEKQTEQVVEKKEETSQGGQNE